MSSIYSGMGPRDFELGDRVSFMHKGERITGEVTRVYNTRALYHVRSDNGSTYQVHINDDEMQPA